MNFRQGQQLSLEFRFESLPVVPEVFFRHCRHCHAHLSIRPRFDRIDTVIMNAITASLKHPSGARNRQCVKLDGFRDHPNEDSVAITEASEARYHGIIDCFTPNIVFIHCD